MNSALAEYLKKDGLECPPCAPNDPLAPAVSIPELPGWASVPPEAVPGAYKVLVNPSHQVGPWVPNAVVLHGRLSEKVAEGPLLDAARSEPASLPKWTEHVVTREPFHGNPSVFLEGTYEVEGLSLFATTRYVVVETADDQFLVQFTLTVEVGALDDLHVDVVTFNSALSIGEG